LFPSEKESDWNLRVCHNKCMQFNGASKLRKKDGESLKSLGPSQKQKKKPETPQ